MTLATRVCRTLSILTVGMTLTAALLPTTASARSAVFGGGPFYSGGTSVMNTLRASGFTTVVLWTIHVHSNGNLVFNDELVVSNGVYVGNSAWPSQLATLKQTPTSVNRIEVSVGSWGVPDFETIRDLIAAQGTGPSSILYRNFQALKNATGADAVDFDDESLYHVGTTVQFGQMLAGLGYKVTLCPYTNSSFWSSVRSQLGSVVDRVYLQVYAGGAGNNPSSWNAAMGTTVDPGVWSRHGSGCSQGDTPATVQSKMTSWKSSAGITGGFMWLFDDMLACSSQGTPAQYAAAINNAVGNPPSGIVQLYQHCDYGGWAASFGSTGNYTTSQIVSAGGVGNDASSLRIASGYKATLYDGDNFTGASVVLTSDTPCLVSHGFNDLLSSMRIEPASSGSGVVFYQHINYGGTASQSLPKGNYTLSQLQARGVPNDWASSMRVPSGWTVILYQHDNFTGTSWTRTSDTPDFRSLTPNANDQVSSVRIQ